MSGSSITIESGEKKFSAYLAVPEAGKGPGIVLCQEIFGVNAAMREKADFLAEEGYTVVVPDLFWRAEPNIELDYTETGFAKAFELYQGFDENLGIEDIQATLNTLRNLDVCDSAAGLGVVGYCLGGKLAYLAACRLPEVACAIGYYGVGIENNLDEAKNIQGKLVLHMAELDQFCSDETRTQINNTLAAYKKNVKTFLYPNVDHAFARPHGDHYDKPSALIAHERTVTALRKAIGPEYDLEALWEDHCKYEFETRDVPATMATMVAEPYVNHIPTLTGGVGYAQLSRFYRHHFVHNNPKDMSLISISRTVGVTQVVDEFIMRFTHDQEIDWLIPGIAPTGKFVEIPMLGVIKFRGPKLCHEHIYWDQASLLVQLGLIDPAGLPVAGAITAHKLLDESIPSNTLMPTWASSEGKPIE
ncbi:dienelactone hydrolase family protein [Acinetobacter sp.]|uniref:dienelactone hydrolase family protein n=1 Tax=Acinetobacter sp. TaxID=472 RepID=UPI00388F1779